MLLLSTHGTNIQIQVEPVLVCLLQKLECMEAKSHNAAALQDISMTLKQSQQQRNALYLMKQLLHDIAVLQVYVINSESMLVGTQS